MRLCSGCKTEKDESEFDPWENTRKILKFHCRSCTERAAETRRKYARLPTSRATLRKFGLTDLDYNKLLAAQNGLCAICHKRPGKKRLAVDHCHKTGRVRGLLCTRCNIAIGCLMDSPDLARAAAEYLERDKAAPDSLRIAA